MVLNKSSFQLIVIVLYVTIFVTFFICTFFQRLENSDEPACEESKCLKFCDNSELEKAKNLSSSLNDTLENVSNNDDDQRFTSWIDKPCRKMKYFTDDLPVSLSVSFKLREENSS